MADMDEGQLERYRAELRRQEMNWQARYQTADNSDMAAVQIGLAAIRAAILVNAGAIVALLTFIGQLWGKKDEAEALRAVIDAVMPFVVGLSCGALSIGLAYLYQSALTKWEIRLLAEVSADSEKLPPFKTVPRFCKVTSVIMISLGAASFACFVWGCIEATSAFRSVL